MFVVLVADEVAALVFLLRCSRRVAFVLSVMGAVTMNSTLGRRVLLRVCTIPTDLKQDWFL